MTIIHIHKWAEPKPGHEFQYYLAWKHRHIAGGILLRATRPWNMLFRPCFHRRAYLLWGDAVDRTKIHGQDVHIQMPKGQ